MKTQLFTLLFMFSASFVLAQTPPVIEWQKALGGNADDLAYSVGQTSDNGYIVAGMVMSNDGDVSGNHGGVGFDAWVVKLDEFGTLQWQKALGGTGVEYAQSVKQTADGGYIVAGYTDSNDGDVIGNHGGQDFWVVKLGNSGTIEWQKSLGGSGNDGASNIIQTTDDGYIVTGYTMSNNGDVSGNHGNQDQWVVKLDGNGAIQWQKTYGGTSNEAGRSIQQTTDGGYIVAGISSSNDGDVSNNQGDYDYWIVKINSKGDIEWEKSFGGLGEEGLLAVRQTAEGGYITAGWTGSNNGDITGNHGQEDGWVVKLSASGSMEWERAFGGSLSDATLDIIQTSDSGYTIAGYTGSNDGDVTGTQGGYDYWAIKIGPGGTIEWQKTFGGNGGDFAYGIVQAADGGYVLAGSSLSSNGDVTSDHTGSNEYWVVKLGVLDTGITGFVTPVSGPLTANEAVTVNVKNYGTITQSGFSVYYNVDGGTNVTETFSGILTAGQEAQFTFTVPADLSTPGQTYTLMSWTPLTGDLNTDNNASVTTVTNTTLGVDDTTQTNTRIYPNPVSNLLSFECDEIVKKIQILDLNGKTIFYKVFNTASGEIHLENLLPGVYFAKLITKKNSRVFKFIKN